MKKFDRRTFIRGGCALIGASFIESDLVAQAGHYHEIPQGERPRQSPNVGLLNPSDLVPLSFIIDDSTCLVNMGHFCMPQFERAFPGRPDYSKPWWDWPREIPDDFVREFADWSEANGVQGKYSIVPNPACVGWLDRGLPGWSHQALQESLKLVRGRLTRNWDIHPEMITHTRVIDLKTGRPYDEVNRHTMENSHPGHVMSVDYMASYISYALQILKNVDLPCEGFTTPGGFGNRVKAELSLGGFQALRAMFSTRIPHYFKYLELDPESSTQPRVEHASGLEGPDPGCIVNVIGGTGDWFGGWDGVSAGQVEESVNRFVSADGASGRMVEMIQKNEPAIMICHWPGIYCNGQKTGYAIYQQVFSRLNQLFGSRTQWMKISQIAEYWAARELTSIQESSDIPIPQRIIELRAPFSASNFTIEIDLPENLVPEFIGRGVMHEVKQSSLLSNQTFLRRPHTQRAALCFNLERGNQSIRRRPA